HLHDGAHDRSAERIPRRETKLELLVLGPDRLLAHDEVRTFRDLWHELGVRLEGDDGPRVLARELAPLEAEHRLPEVCAAVDEHPAPRRTVTRRMATARACACEHRRQQQ